MAVVQVAEKAPVPILIYNNPTAIAGIDLDSETMIGISRQSPNVVGVKLSCGSAGKLNRLVASLDASSFTPFCGKADVVLADLVGGSEGVVSGLANIAPRTVVEVVRLYGEGKLDDARGVQATLALAESDFNKVSVLGAKRVCVERFGYGNIRVRAPLPEAQDETFLPLRGALQSPVELEKKLTASGLSLRK